MNEPPKTGNRRDIKPCEPCFEKWKKHRDGLILATGLCKNCDEYLCDSCIDHHSRQKRSKRHKIIRIEENLNQNLTDHVMTIQQSTEDQESTFEEDFGNTRILTDGSDKNLNNNSIKTNVTHQSTDDHEKSSREDSNLSDIISSTNLPALTNENSSLSLQNVPISVSALHVTLDQRQKLKYLLDKEFREWLSDNKYSKLCPIISKPVVEDNDLQNFLKIVSPYLIQRIKMWNGNVVSPQNINSFFKQKSAKKKRTRLSSDKIISASRIDFLTIVLNTAGAIIAQEILVKLSKFHIAIPLVVQDIGKNGTVITTLPIIRNIVIKLEPQPGQIIENHLFSNQFRLIVAVRVGISDTGKSTILNQLMKKSHVFSSCCEPINWVGRPLSLDGVVELIWLTQDTCNESIWNDVLREHYKNKSPEVVLLANMHGESLEHLETIRFLERLSSVFIVFQMPDCTDEKLSQLEQIISNKKTIRLLVNPECNETQDYEISTGTLKTNDILETLSDILQECLSVASNVEPDDLTSTATKFIGNDLRFSELTNCQHADAIVKFASKKGCLRIKQLMKDIMEVNCHSWSDEMETLLRLSTNIFCLDVEQAKMSLNYLETQLSIISAEQSVSAQEEVRRAKIRLRKIVSAPTKTTDVSKSMEGQHQAELKSAHEKLQIAMKKINDLNLGQEHFFRILGHIYSKNVTGGEFQKLQSVQHLPANLAQLLIAGHAIEIFDGDSGDMQSIWIQEILKHVWRKLPNIKVFVISIIGLQSSGKSTLLNALFSCKFAVSIGRCSRGLFMRMIFLERNMEKSHGFKCILLIDTEGLSSPEKMNDEKTSQKDRLMATFAMGISNLTIVNILGEGMTEMTEILQIAIVAMARLRSGGIRPDILLVQHLHERNEEKMELAKGQFSDAINKAFELISKNDVEIGSASAECLTELIDRIHSGDLFKHFGAFKDGASVNAPPSLSYHEDVVNLYETLLERAKSYKMKPTLELWSLHLESYWNCAKAENFALNFKNVKQITEFLFFEKLIAKVKEELDAAIRFHRDIFSKQIKEIVASLIVSKKEFVTDEVREKLLASIAEKNEMLPFTCVRNSFGWNLDLECGIRNENLEQTDCEACKKFQFSHMRLRVAVSETEWEHDVETSLEDHRRRLLNVTVNMLKQTFDGSVVRQGYFSEFSGVISKELEQALRQRPHGKYSDNETQDIAEKIFSSLRQIASLKQTDPDNLSEDILQAVVHEFAETEIPELFKSEITLDVLRYISDIRPGEIKSFWNIGRFIPHIITKVFKSFRTKTIEPSTPNTIQTDILIEVLDEFIIRILQSDGALPKGLDFAQRKVRQIHLEFTSLIKEYEFEHSVELGLKFKQYMEAYTLQKLKKKLSVSYDIHKRMCQALNREYVKTGYLTDILDRFETNMTNEILLNSKAIKLDKTKDSCFNSELVHADRLNKQNLDKVLDELHKLIFTSFRSRDDNWETVGLNFEDGMVSEVKNGFPEEIKNFERQFNVVLQDTFKVSLQIYSLQQLRDKMIELQAIWNRDNKPIEILEQKREDYRREIEARLKHGFSGAGDGLIIGMMLTKSVKGIAVQEAYTLKLRTVKDVPWTTNAENVRLHYFEKLAEEVARGDKERAIEHFRNPKQSIETWFKKEVNSMHIEEKVKEIYRKTIETVLKSIIRKINVCSEKAEIDELVNDYIKGVDDQYYSKLNGKEVDISTFKSSLTRHLEEYLNSEDFKTVSFPSASDDPEIMGRLGCTEHCFWCGALCWGSREHQSGKETGIQIERHHTCHQPSGLIRVADRHSRKLLAEACHLRIDLARVWFGEFHKDKNGMLWSVAKEEHFKNWRFDPHCITSFDELMRWFFQELHSDIANQNTKDLLPADENDLKKFNCTGLKLNEILEVVRSKLQG